MEYNLKITSVSGDLHTGGLADEPTTINIPYKNKKTVDAFLKYQTIFHNSARDKSFPNKTSQKAFDKLQAGYAKLLDAKIFHNKYYFRTQWRYDEW
tara:strand:- start:329 stop:616 length:288 start_codon:yes stop_codon:yes gene_type:complete